jgi:DNA-binding MarR family transcriptional regulator
LDRRTDLNAVAGSARAAFAKLNRRLRAQDDSDGVGSTGLSLLGRLSRDGPSTATALAMQERLQPQSLTRVLRALEARNFIARCADAADRRRSTITITKDGSLHLLRTLRRRETWLAKAIGSTLSSTEREMLVLAITLVERIADADD